MTKREWESLCDGCGKCCLHKYEYEDTGEIDHTNVACRYLDLNKCNCTQYKRRHELVEDCIALTAKMVGNLSWLPVTCAYRRLDEGKTLPKWHPLITGDPRSEEHTSELQSLMRNSYAAFCLKKKKQHTNT